MLLEKNFFFFNYQKNFISLVLRLSPPPHQGAAVYTPPRADSSEKRAKILNQKSIFEGPRNQNFFKNAVRTEVEILAKEHDNSG